MSKKKKIITIIETPDQFEIYESIRKQSVPQSQRHRQKKGKGSHTRKKKHPKREEE